MKKPLSVKKFFSSAVPVLLAVAQVLFFLDSCSSSIPEPVSEFEEGALYEDQGVKVVCLYGDWEQMGRQWGALGQGMMLKILDFIEARTHSDPSDVESFTLMAENVYSHYPEHLKRFIEASAETSGLSLDQVKAVNALEWGEASFHCSGIACWGGYSDGPLVYGRNYDAHSFADLGNEIAVTVFHPSGEAQNFAIVGYAGEMYCVNGFNESGLFVELNNGMASSGFEVNFDISLSTTELMRLVADARSLEDADEFFATTPSASGFLIGVTDGRSARCYEWSGDRSHRADDTTPEGLMVMSNHFVNPEWEYPDPTEENSWQSHARRANMLAFAESEKGHIDAAALRSFMRIPIADGGPSMPGLDMYQIVAVPSQKYFYLNIPGTDVSWSKIDLEKYFSLSK